VFADAGLEDGAAAVVQQLAAGPRGAMVACKRLLRHSLQPDVTTLLRTELEQIRSQAGSADGREGMKAFLDKRPPQFEGASQLAHLSGLER
jgi:2-(1,2-epoxy-1,2-dihydrophenyl)acetyl-CoA isomerase